MINPPFRRLKVLITVHEISPELGSECTSGWNIITRLGYYHDLTVLYAETNQFGTKNYKEHIGNYILKNGEIPGVEFIAIPQPPMTNFITGINKKLSDRKTSVGLSFLYFFGAKFWEKSVFEFSSRLLKKRNIDLIHHFNHLSFREPGFLWKFDKPFIWGPASGLSRVPVAFLYKAPLNELIFNVLRNSLNYIQFFMNTRIRKAIKKSQLIYFVTSDDGLLFRKKSQRAENLLDMGAYDVNRSKDINSQQGVLKVLWVGRFSFLKALDLLLRATAASDLIKKKVEISIIGDGPQKDYYQKIAEDLELKNVKWLGQIPREKVFEIMLDSDVLVHTSIKEAASAVILESLSAGLPVVCHDAFGMSFAINNNCGIKIPFISPAKSIVGFKLALEKLCVNPHLISELKSGAIKRAQELSWDSMAERIAGDYVSVLTKFDSDKKF